MITKNYNLAEHTTLRTPATASYCIILTNPILAIEEKALLTNRSVIILGDGSNTFFVSDFDGVIIRNKIQGKKIVEKSDHHVIVEIGAGENWDQFVVWSLDRNFYGLENLSLIPGTVGAAPVQNIGAYGKEIANYVLQVTGIDLQTGKTKSYTKKECNFGYRTSIFKTSLKNKFLITYVTFQLDLTFKPEISYATLTSDLEQQNIKLPNAKQVRQAVIRVRQSRLPDWTTIPNAGSFFQNPITTKEHYKKLQSIYPEIPHYLVDTDTVKIPAAWLIDQSDLKGFSQGNVSTYQKQPLVIISNGKASGQEIVDFANNIRTVVSEKFGIMLDPEVNCIGYDFKNT